MSAHQSPYNVLLILLNHRKPKSFEGLPPSDNDPSLSDGSPRPLGKRRHAIRLRRLSTPSDIDSMTQVGLEGEDPDDNDYGDPFRPKQSDGYDDRGSVEPTQPLQSHLQAPPLDAITLASIQTLREVRIMTTQWVLNLGPLDDWPFVFQQHYDIATSGYPR